MKILIALIAVVLGLVAAPNAWESNPAPFHFDAAMRWLQTCNDWQSPVTGTCVTDTPAVTGGRPCAWGDEDDLADLAIGKLTAGQTVTDTLCVVTDMCNDGACPHTILYQANDTNASALTVTLTSDRGGSWSAPPVRSGKGYVWQLCFLDPLWTGDPLFADYPLIVGTNGGVGFVTNYTLHVHANKTTQAGAGFEVAQNGLFGYSHTFPSVPCP